MEVTEKEIEPIKKIFGFSSNVMFQPFYENAIRAGHERGGNALGIEANGPLTGELPSLRGKPCFNL
jgi:hypothetical protein